MSEETFPIPEKLIKFLTDVMERWVKITGKTLEWHTDQAVKIHVISPAIVRIRNYPDYIYIEKVDAPSDPKYNRYYKTRLGYVTYEINLYIGEIKEGEFELIDVDVEDRETCRCECA